MDIMGFVSVSVLSEFRRIKSLTIDPMIVLAAGLASEKLEVDRDTLCIRKKGDWSQYLPLTKV